MIVQIAYKEFITAFRDKRILLLSAFIILLLALAAYGGYQQYRNLRNERNRAQVEKRQQWLNQDPKHPHMAAHFGTFAFKTKTVFSLFDQGLDNYTGTMAYLEPHRQNDFLFKPAEERGASIRFGELGIAMVLQLLFPLLIIFLCFSSFAHEKESGTLKIMLSQGVSLKQVFVGKLLGLFGILICILVPALVISIVFLVMATNQQSAVGIPEKLLAMVLAYLSYFLLFTALSLFVSARVGKSKSALLIMLGFWIVWCIVLPKWAANIGDDNYPLPSQNAFVQGIKKDIAQGINGHDPHSGRADKLKQALLKQYHVDTISKLPFNFEGYVMQAGEAYSSMVYDKHFQQLQQTLQDQNKASVLSSIINPYLAIRNLSMGIAGTDAYTHSDFQQQAEAYRRAFVKKMNNDMQEHSHLGDWDYKANKQLFASVPPFQYQAPSLYKSLQHYPIEVLSLCCWLIILSAIIYFNIPKTTIIKQ